MSPDTAHDASWSADGHKVAFTAGSVYVSNADGSGHQRLTSDPAPDFEADPVWSPDGQQIAFTRWGDSSSDIYVMNADGAGSGC